MVKRIELMSLEALQAHPLNPKDHDLGAIQESVQRFGFVDAVIIDERTGRLVSGHGRVETLRAMRAGGQRPPEGLDAEWRVPVQRGWASKDDGEASAYLVAANRTVELGGWDDAKLTTLLAELAKTGEGALVGVGFDTDDVDRMINALAAESVADAPVVEVATTDIKRGDVFRLGEHVLVCGDSTNASDVSAVMGDEQAACVWTDPPYGVDYEGAAGAIANDDKAGLAALLAGAFAQCFRVLKPGGGDLRGASLW